MNYFPEQTKIVLNEIPDEITLVIPFSGCGCNCKECHSKEFQNKNNGKLFNDTLLNNLLECNKNKVSCICFFEGSDRNLLIHYAEIAYKNGYNTAVYSGKDNAFEFYKKYNSIKYIKEGHYDKNFGGLNNKNTNQRLYKKINDHYEDITSKFWR